MRLRDDNQIGPTTIKRCRYRRRQYRKKNRTRAHIKNGNYKRKNTIITRKKYKGGFLGRLKTWWASRKNPYKLVNDAPVSNAAAWANVAEKVRQEELQFQRDSIAAERLLNQRERDRSATKLSWKDRWNGFRANFTRKQPHQPPTTESNAFHKVATRTQSSLKEQLESELRAEKREAASAWKEAKLRAEQQKDALAWKEAVAASKRLTVPHKEPVLLSITNDDYTQMPPPYIFSNIDSITNRVNYQSQPKSVDEWNVFKGAILMPTWNAYVEHMKAHVEFMGLPTTTQAPVFKKIIAQRNALLEHNVGSVDPLSSHPVFTKSEAAIWEVVCDTEIVRNILIHSISNFTCAESIGTCLAFQRFLFPFSTDIVSELYKKRFPIEFEATPRDLTKQRQLTDFEKTTLNFQQQTELKLKYIRHKSNTEDMLKSDIGVITTFATILLQSIMIQMSRDDYYCTYQLNAKRELLLRLVICIIMTNRREIMKMLHMHMGILILFEVDDNKSKHYDEYKEIMTEILKGYAYAANQESYPYIQECEAIAEKYSKRLKISRAAEITVLPVQTNNPVQDSPPLQPIIKRANVAECNSTTSINDLKSLCENGKICQSLGSLTNKGSKYYVYPQNKLCDPVTGKLADNATILKK